MTAGPLQFRKTLHTRDASRVIDRSEIAVSALVGYRDGWLLDGEYRNLSHRTILTRRGVVDRLIWFLEKRKFSNCGVPELRAFIGYVAHGDGDRWDSHHPGLIRDIAEKPIRPSTIKTYHSYLASFFAWMTAEGFLTISPMKRVVAPIDREKNKVVPFSAKQAEQLLCASTTGPFPLRDEAIVLFLLDTGVRASELVSIKMEDLDRSNKTASVLGKGNKRRIVRYGLETSRALWRYICTRLDGLEPKAPLFVSCNGHRSGSALTADGLADIIERLGDAAEIHGVRCSPHTLRHTFAVSFLRGGGNSFALQMLLGHSDMKMTAKYVMIAQCDLAEQHAMASPVDNLKRRK